ncbi:MAG: zinc ribbon domain-containing protein [Planctomycetota bacterium]
MKSLWFVASFGLVAAVSPAAEDFLPLQAGNHWTYAFSNGIQTEVEVAGFETVNGVRCAVVTTTMQTPAGSQTMTELLSSGAKGILAYKTQDLVLDPPHPRLRLPFVAGETWKVTATQNGVRMEITYRSVGPETVQTAAGSFSTVKVEGRLEASDGSQMTTTSWYADGVGLVRQSMTAQFQELVAELQATNVRRPPPSPAPPAPPAGTPDAAHSCPGCGVAVPPAAEFCPECGARVPAPAPARPTACPQCGAALGTEQKFCGECGARIEGAAAPPAAPPPGDGPALERYASADGRLLCFKPRDWLVQEESGFAGAGSYRVALVEPEEAAVVLFATFPVIEEIPDSVALAARSLEAIGEEFEGWSVGRIESSPDRARTIAELNLVSEGQPGTGHAYFFLTDRLGTMFLLVARAEVWNEMRPLLTTVAANLAYAPGGVENVLREGQTRAVQSCAAPEGRVLSPAAMLQAAAQRPGRQLPCVPAALRDGSAALQIPPGWSLEGEGLQYVLVDDPRARTRGFSSVWHTILPPGMPVPGAMSSPYLPPPQAFQLLLEWSRSGTELEILAQCGAEMVPGVMEAVRQQRAMGLEVDVRLLHVRFRSPATGEPIRGLFTVNCAVPPMATSWQCTLEGCWAPEAELDEYLPFFVRLGQSVQVNQTWLAQDASRRAAARSRRFASLQNSIAEANQAFDQYLDSVQNADRSRDYSSWAWSQTTLGQGTWVAENEGARVYQTDSWGLQGPEGRIDSPAYNTTNFTGESPWGELEQVDTREEYDRYVR